MKDRITQFLKSEGISPAEFADKIGVQRSSVSHVLNGRNYPSASFIQKMLSIYKTLNSRWLLLGEGPVFEVKTPAQKEPLLFHVPVETEGYKAEPVRTRTPGNSVLESSNQPDNKDIGKPISPVEINRTPESVQPLTGSDLTGYLNDAKVVERIVFFFADKTFNVYTPSK